MSPGVAIPVENVQSPPASLEQMFRDHHSVVYRAAYRITGNASDAEDVLQTVFLRLLRREADLAAVENAESYLRRAAVNAALDLMRSRQSGRLISIDETDLPL